MLPASWLAFHGPQLGARLKNQLLAVLFQLYTTDQSHTIFSLHVLPAFQSLAFVGFIGLMVLLIGLV